MVSLLAVQIPGAHAVSCLSSVLLLTTQCSSWSLIWRPNYLSGKDGLYDLRRFLFWLSSCYTSSVARSYLVFSNSRERILLSCFCLFSSPKVCIILDSVFWETAGHLCLSYIHPSLCVFSSIFFYLLSLNLDLRVICLNDIQSILSIPFLLVSIMSHHLIRLMVLNTYGLSSLSNLSIKRCPLLMATF